MKSDSGVQLEENENNAVLLHDKYRVKRLRTHLYAFPLFCQSMNGGLHHPKTKHHGLRSYNDFD